MTGAPRQFPQFSRNGAVCPIEEALVPLEHLEVIYGFGVYETIRVRNKTPLFLTDHLERLHMSAEAISLEHTYGSAFITNAITALIATLPQETYNLKILLYGAPDPQNAQLYILASNPHFPSEKNYRDGVHTITVETERPFPHAKTLNMLPSYRAYTQAKKQGAYDALLVNRRGEVTEGTRTNVFALRGNTLVSPPERDILLGVTRKHVLDIARSNGMSYVEAPITIDALDVYDALFLTSTSTGIMPIRSISDIQLPPIPEVLRTLMKAFSESF